MRIGILGGVPPALGGGGLEVQLARTAAALAVRGHEIVRVECAPADAEWDVLHAFGAEGNVQFALEHWTRARTPLVISPVIVVSSLDLAYALLDIAALSFLGLGIQPPTPDWGSMLSEGQLVLLTAPHLALAAGFAIVLGVLGFNLLGDGLCDVLDPRQAQR